MKEFKKTLLIDLDGVLNTYHGDYNNDFIPPIRDGAKELLEKLYLEYEIKLFTSRNKLLACKWIIENDLDKFITDVTSEKQPAFLYIDDRAISFNGNYSKLFEDIKNFKVWYSA